MQDIVKEITAESVGDLIATAAEKGQAIRFVDYAGSKGDVTTFDAVPITDKEGAYSRFLKASLEWLNTLERPSHLPDNAWFPAKDEVRQSWEASLAGLNSSKRASSRVWLATGSPWVKKDEMEPTTLQVTMFERVSQKTEPGESKVAHKSGVTEAKAWLRNNAPLSRLIFELVLFPGKVTQLELIQNEPTP